MSEHRSDAAVEPLQLTVDIPRDVAQQIRDCQARDPEFLRRILLFGITHRVVFETLSQAWRG